MVPALSFAGIAGPVAGPVAVPGAGVAALIYVRLVGPIRIEDASGQDCTPRGARARGLVALLCLSPDRQRTRRWIEARLWSDRAPDQASGSLRQALVEIRGAFGAASGAIRTDREMISLLSVETDLERDPEAARTAMLNGRELLEAIDLRDSGFAAWLADQRNRILNSALPDETEERGVALPLLVQTSQLPRALGGFVTLALADAIGGLVSEFATVDVYGTQGALVQVGPQDRGLELTVQASEAGGQLNLIVSMGARRTGQILWSRQTAMPLDTPELTQEGIFPSLVFEAAEAALAALPRLTGEDATPLRAEALISRAVREMFSFDSRRLLVADRLLRDAATLQPSARVYAWHALLRQIMAVERLEGDRQARFAEADFFARKAMEGAPDNPLVLALVSQVRVMLDGNADAGSALARDAMARSPNNAFALAAEAGSLLRAGKYDRALQMAQRGAMLASRSSFLHWWESLSGLAQVASGNYLGAIAAYEAAHARAPQFRSPLRHLLFLYIATGQTEKAVRVLNDLRLLEPDFSMARIRQDPDYPAFTLRQTHLLKLTLLE